MKTYFDCIPCFVRQTLEVAQMVAHDPDVQHQVLREVLRHIAEMDINVPPPLMGATIHRIVRKITGVTDPYRDVKKKFNAFALGLYPELSRRIDESRDPLSAAIHLAAAGNIIDLGAGSGLEQAHIHDAIDDALSAPLDPAELERLRDAVTEADDILYLGDNAGEIVFDRMFIERLPREKITFVVRGKPIINDALMEDAVETGITSLVPVIDNGSDVPGTALDDSPPEFRERFDRADLIVAKGQGNYETLSDVNKPIFFLLKAKCPVIARDLGCEIGALVCRRK